MEVVLLQDVKQLGTQGAVVKVKPGYARNFLLPRGLAVTATPDQLRNAEEVRKQRAGKLERLMEQSAELKQQIESKKIQLELNVGEDDKPFGSITANDILQALSQSGITVDKHAIQLEHPIKTLGATEVPIRLHPEVTAKLNVVVVKAS